MTAGATYSPTNRFPWLASVPLAKLILETDAPYFPPRGAARQVALPGDVAHVAARVAAIKGVTMEEVLESNLKSVEVVYGLKIHEPPLGPSNQGYHDLKKLGWSPWNGLGKVNQGRQTPVEAINNAPMYRLSNKLLPSKLSVRPAVMKTNTRTISMDSR